MDMKDELDFSVDREHWLATPTEAQRHTAFSLGGFYVGEERVTADLAPFLLAAPSGEVEMFLATQLVDEARHTAFFDRFGGEVMALDWHDEDLDGEGAVSAGHSTRRDQLLGMSAFARRSVSRLTITMRS